MSSLVRRIQRTVTSSQNHYEPGPQGTEGKWVISPPREIHFGGRGKRLGISNPKAKDLLARKTRDAKWGRA